MNYRSKCCRLATLLVLLTSIPSSLADVYAANMTGAEEVGYGYIVPPTYIGNAVVNFYDLNNGSTVLAFTLTQSGLDPILQVFLERRVDPSNGVLALDLTPVIDLSAFSSSGSAHGQALLSTLVAVGIQEQPGLFYLNVKTKNFSPGAIRGDLVDVTPNPATGQLPTAVIVANLTSDQVVPAFKGQPGSADAIFDFYTLTNSSSYVEFGFKDLGNVSEIESVSIHSGAVGVNGPAVINLTQAINVDAFDSNGFAFGVIVLTSDVAFKLINNPAALYVQISTTNATLPQIRGQLSLNSTNLPPSPGTPLPSANVTYLSVPPPPIAQKSTGYTSFSASGTAQLTLMFVFFIISCSLV